MFRGLGDKNMTRNIRLIYLHNFLLDFRPQWAFLAIYCAQVTGSYTTGMAVMATQKLAGALTDIPTGILSDKIGRKNTIVLGSLIMLLASVCYAFADGSAVMFLAALLTGFSESLFSGNNDALLYESLKEKNQEERLHHHQSRTESMFQLGLGLSALLSMLFVQDGLRLVFMVGIIPQILSFVVSLFFVESKNSSHAQHGGLDHFLETIRSVLRNKKLSLLLLGNAVGSGAAEAHFGFITVFIQQLWPTWGLGFYRGLHHALAFVGCLFAGKIIDIFKPLRAVVAVRIYVLVSSSLALVLANMVSPVFYLSNALTYGAGNAARSALMQKEFNDKQRATLGSVVSFATKMVYGGTSLMLGLLADHMSVRAAAGFAVGLGLLSLPTYLKVFKRYL